MAFSDLQIKAASEAAVIASHRNIAKLGLFVHSFRGEIGSKPFQSCTVPLYDLSSAQPFVAGTNDYGTGTNELEGITISLDKHYVKSVSITDKEEAFTGIAWARDTATALADNLTRKVNEVVFGELSSSDITLSADVSLSSKSTIANLYAVADTNDIPVNDAVVVLRPAEYAKVLGELDASVYGRDDAVVNAVVPGLYGFCGFMCSTNLPEAYTVGAIISRGAIGIVNRYLAPYTEGQYAEAWSITD